ncbi:SdrH family protein [Staphylococcus cohnii]|uniref:SdrH family protein n=1 Tax=Staphylococcus cohnii TaxID=29382 RepID=UPI003D7E777C
MKGYKMNKILVSSFAFAISASLLSKPIQAAEDQKNNISTDTKDVLAGNDDMRRSNFVPSISDLYSTDGKENFDTNVENNNTIKNELSADKLNSGEKEKSVDDDVFNNEGTDTPVQPDEPNDGDTSDLSEDDNTGEPTTPDETNEDESTPSEPDNPSDEDTSDSNDGDNSGTNEGTDEPTNPGRPNGGGGTPPKPDKPSNGDTSGSNGGTDEPTNPGRPNGGGGTSPKPDKPSNGDTSGSNGGTGVPTTPDRPNDGGGTSSKPDNPSEGSTSGSNGGTGVPTNPDRPNLTPPQTHYPNKPSNGNHRSGNGDAYQPTQPVKPSNPTRPNLKRPSENTQPNKNQNEINYGDLSVKQDTSQTSSSTNSDRQILNRFNQMSTGSFKYNPFVVNQVKQLNNGEQKISNRDILSILRPQRFDDNAFLNELQKGTNYFKFQYFNPLKSQDYYQNLDNQVLALITGEIGSMPDLKNPKTESASGKYEYHSSSDEEMTETADKNSKNTIDIKFERTLFALITAIFMIFIGVVVGYFVHRKNKNNE